MYIEMDKYCWNSLRKGRLLGFENDVEEAFTVFKNYMLEPEDITVHEFLRIAEISKFQFITKCRAEQEDEEQFIQLLYQILIGNLLIREEHYFMSQNQAKQIFAIYGLYFLYCQLERKRKINVDSTFLDQFLVFLKKNGSKADREWMMIAKRLIQSCISIGVKTGLKTYLIKPNGQPARKGRYVTTQTKKLESKQEQNQQQTAQEKTFLHTLKGELSNLQMSLSTYSKGKDKFNAQLNNSENKLVFSDKNIAIRLAKKFNQYEKLLAQKHNQDK